MQKLNSVCFPRYNCIATPPCPHHSAEAAPLQQYKHLIERLRRVVHTDTVVDILLGLDSDTFYIYHVAAVMVDNLRRLLLGINLSDKAIMDFDFPGVGFPV